MARSNINTRHQSPRGLPKTRTFEAGFFQNPSFTNFQMRAFSTKKWRCIAAIQPLNGGDFISLKNVGVLGAAAKRQTYWRSLKVSLASVLRYISRSSSQLMFSKVTGFNQEATRFGRNVGSAVLLRKCFRIRPRQPDCFSVRQSVPSTPNTLTTSKHK